jgi:Tfp pilus assembly protein PilX
LIRKNLNVRREQQGFLALVAVLLIIVIGFLGIAVTYMFVGSTRATSDHFQSAQAFWLAESGLEQATYQLLASTLTNRSACSGLNISNTLGAGAYTITSTGPSYATPSTLNGALTAAATTVPVVSTAGYQSSGRLMIDRELMNYAAISGNTFVGVMRGIDTSVAATHFSGASVGQYQCNLSSQGGVTSLTTPTNPGDPFGKRILQEAVQLQDAWAVGDHSGSNYTLIRFNKPTEVTWNNAAAAGTLDLNDISMLSYVDGWAVGGSKTFLHWTGLVWNAVATGLGGSSYDAIFCNASNDCHAAGKTRKIAHWNGAAWSNVTPTGSLANTNLVSINCDTSTDCWAVGSSAGGGKFYHGTGSPLAWVGIDESALTVSANTVNSVFCNSANDCWAVGTGKTFARKNGANWADFVTALPAIQYNRVFCNSTSDCWTVGNVNGANDVIAHWNGSSWALDISNPTPIANLTDIKCAGTNDCWAVGSTKTGTNPAFVHWNGVNWVQVATSGLPLATGLNALAIISPNSQPQAAWQESYP